MIFCSLMGSTRVLFAWVQLPGNQWRLQEVEESRQELIQSVTTLKERIVFHFLSGLKEGQ